MLVEDSAAALRAVGAYIDLNARLLGPGGREGSEGLPLERLR